jgi:FixJ family two-component response regulator
MSASPQMIHIVDDDPAIRDALTVVFDLEGYDVASFETGEAFLDTVGIGQKPDCVILDVHMPGQSGIEILRRLHQDGFATPVFVISGQGDIPMAVEAIKQGAHDFIEKPFDAETVVTRVRDAIVATQKAAGEELPQRSFPGADTLTPREREVLEEITAGASNKEAGRTLGISPRTIEVHRARIMEKLGARNAADLVRIVLSRD